MFTTPRPSWIVKTVTVLTCLPAREPPQKMRGLGEFFFGRGQGEPLSLAGLGGAQGFWGLGRAPTSSFGYQMYSLPTLLSCRYTRESLNRVYRHDRNGTFDGGAVD